MENGTSKILWDFSIYTDWAIHHGCPNIVLIDKVDSRVKIIDIAVLWDANIESKYGEKVDHYKYLAIQGAKKIVFTACHSGKLKPAFTSPDVISTSLKNFLTNRTVFTVFLLFEFLKKHHLPVG